MAVSSNSAGIGTALPLDGLTVVELGTSVAGPYAGQVLAELGATVIKIENPQGGDDARHWGPPFIGDNSALFHAVNRNKRSATVDFKDAAQLAHLRDFIAARADIVLQNLRPGLVEKLGLDAASLRAAQPKLIYCNLAAFGNAGPLKDAPGYDPLMQAYGGIMSVTGHDGAEPARVGPSIVDQGAGMWSVIGILAALHRRTETGQGCVVDTSLYETAIGWMFMHFASYLASGAAPKRMGTENFGIAPYKAFATRDGWIVIAAGNDNLFKRLAQALDRPDLAEEARFRHNPDRVAHRTELNDLIAGIVATQTLDHWFACLRAAGVPCAPVQTLDRVRHDAQFAAVEMLQPAPDGSVSLIGIPLQFDGARPTLRRTAPDLGEANDILSDATPNDGSLP